ncbi:MAG: hypothetical protein ACR2J4_06135, partial [Deinococcus sp.]
PINEPGSSGGTSEPGPGQARLVRLSNTTTDAKGEAGNVTQRCISVPASGLLAVVLSLGFEEFEGHLTAEVGETFMGQHHNLTNHSLNRGTGLQDPLHVRQAQADRYAEREPWILAPDDLPHELTAGDVHRDGKRLTGS